MRKYKNLNTFIKIIFFLGKSKLEKSDSINILAKILFENNNVFELKPTTWTELLKKSSSQLVLPSFYISLLKQKKINANKELLNYCKKIYKINLNRNKQLLIELKEISSIFNKNNINYIFLKGSALVISKCYIDLDRMIGDIDILVDKKDLNNAYKLLKKANYNSKTNTIFSYQKHYPRLVNKSKLFAVELHKNLLDIDNSLLISEDILNSKQNFDNMPVASAYFQALNIIYNYQINDFGYNTCEVSLKALADINELYSKFNIKSVPNNKYVRGFHFFVNKNNKKISILRNSDLRENKINGLRIFLKSKYKLYNIIDYKLSYLFSKSNKRFKQILEFIKNNEFRYYLVKSIFNRNK